MLLLRFSHRFSLKETRTHSISLSTQDTSHLLLLRPVVSFFPPLPSSGVSLFRHEFHIPRNSETRPSRISPEKFEVSNHWCENSVARRCGTSSGRGGRRRRARGRELSSRTSLQWPEGFTPGYHRVAGNHRPRSFTRGDPATRGEVITGHRQTFFLRAKFRQKVKNKIKIAKMK